jgi:alkaline phosphatase D
MNLSRRDFLLQAALLGFGLATAKGAGKQLSSQTIERRDLYPQGVASGDPTADSVICVDQAPCGFRKHGQQINRSTIH